MPMTRRPASTMVLIGLSETNTIGWLHTPGLATFVLCAFTAHQSVLIGHDELAQTLHHLMEDVGGNDTIAQDFLSPLCPHGVHLFASSPWPVNTGCCLEAIVITMCYRM